MDTTPAQVSDESALQKSRKANSRVQDCRDNFMYPKPPLKGNIHREGNGNVSIMEGKKSKLPVSPQKNQLDQSEIDRCNNIYHQPNYVDNNNGEREPSESDYSVQEEEAVQSQIGQPWTTGIFDCQQNKTNALMTAFLPCVTFGQIAEIITARQTSCAVGSCIYLLLMPIPCLRCFIGAKYRGKLRNTYNLVEAPFADCMSHLCCSCCSLSQEFRELQNRGLDPNLGWNGVLAQQQAVQQIHHHRAQCPPQDQVMST